MLHCWEGGHDTDGMSTSCMLELGHDGDHKPTRDDSILITFPGGTSGTIAEVKAFYGGENEKTTNHHAVTRVRGPEGQEEFFASDASFFECHYTDFDQYQWDIVDRLADAAFQQGRASVHVAEEKRRET